MELAQRSRHPAPAAHVRSLTGWRERAGPDLGAIALDCGYYDQAHFNRDFRAFSGRTPAQYRVTSVQAGAAAAA